MTGEGYKEAGDIDLDLPSLITATVERANPATINKIGKMVSIPRVLLSLTCIRIFFFMTVIVWLKNTLVSAESVIVYSSSSFSSAVMGVFSLAADS